MRLGFQNNIQHSNLTNSSDIATETQGGSPLASNSNQSRSGEDAGNYQNIQALREQNTLPIKPTISFGGIEKDESNK